MQACILLDLQEFEKRNVAVVGCSVDSKHTHWAWLNTELKNGGIKGVKYPLVSDRASAHAGRGLHPCAASWALLHTDPDGDGAGSAGAPGPASRLAVR